MAYTKRCSLYPEGLQLLVSIFGLQSMVIAVSLEVDGKHGRGCEQRVVLERGRRLAVGVAVPDTSRRTADRLSAALAYDDRADQLVPWQPEVFDAGLDVVADLLR